MKEYRNLIGMFLIAVAITIAGLLISDAIHDAAARISDVIFMSK